MSKRIEGKVVLVMGALGDPGRNRKKTTMNNTAKWGHLIKAKNIKPE